jgi:hypothetical protein
VCTFTPLNILAVLRGCWCGKGKTEPTGKAVLKDRSVHINDRSDTMTKNSDAIPNMQDSTKEITGFVPTQDELIHLVKYWATKAIHDRYFIFWGQCFGNSDLRCIDFDWQRVDEIAQLLGEEETDKAVKKAYEDIAHEFERDDWIVFRYGTAHSHKRPTLPTSGNPR